MNTDKILAESIAKDYAPKKNTKIIALKKLDNKAKLPATIFAYTFGIISSLVVGVGMCLAMQVIASGTVAVVFGIIIGIIGFTGCGLNYPVYKCLFENIFNPVLERFHYQETDRKYVMMYYLNGVNAIILEWIRDGCIRPTGEISRIISACIFGLEQSPKNARDAF